MSRETRQTESLTRYLLGDMPEEERARLEDDFLGDDTLFERVADAERDLVDDYVGGRLAARDRDRFEQHYLQLPGSRERLQTARLIARERDTRAAAAAARSAAAATAPATPAETAPAETAPPAATPAAAKPGPERPGLLESLRAFWRGAFPSVTPYAVGLAALALAVGGVWWAVTRGVGNEERRAPELAETRPAPTPRATPETTPTPAVTQPGANAQPDPNAQPTPGARHTPGAQPGANANAAAPPRENTPRENTPRTSPTPAPARPRAEPPTVTVLALVAGLTRGEGGANRLVVPKGAGAAVRLEFPLGAGDYREVRASLRTVEGREVWAGPVRPARGGKSAALTLPARLFSADDYLLILSGADASGERTEFQEFYLNAEVR